MNPFAYVTGCFCLIACLFFVPACSAQDKAVPGKLFPRKYQAGDTYRYRLTTEQLYNGQWNATTVVVMEVKVMKDSAGLPVEEVRHISKLVYTPKDTSSMDAEALSVKPYRISLHPGGQLSIPTIEQAGMTAAITDFITFYVAISPQLGATVLEKRGDSLIKKETVKGNFSNGKTILIGEDCLAIKAYLTDVTATAVKLRTEFMPPAAPCLSLLLSDMHQPVVAGIPNNIQMVQPVGPNAFNLQFGNEAFTINTTVNRKDGKISDASMYNVLRLTLRTACDSSYQNCKREMPFRIERNLRLELLR